MSARIELIEGENTPEREQIANNLRAFNRAKMGDTKKRVFTLAAKNDEGRLIGGLVGLIYWDWLFVDWLWLEESARGQDLGTSLIRQAEEIAKKAGCKAAHLDTFSFQAKGFYEKQGYVLHGQLDQCPYDQTRYYLRKDLA